MCRLWVNTWFSIENQNTALENYMYAMQMCNKWQQNDGGETS